MKQHNFFFIVAAMMLLTACSEKSDLLGSQSNGRVPLTLTAGGSTATPMRAASNLYTATSGFDGGEQVKVWMYQNEEQVTESALYDVGAPTAGKSDLILHSGETVLTYPAGESGAVSLYGVYPAISTTSHTVSYDQTDDEAYKVSDLMYAKVPVTWASTTEKYAMKPNLPFTHQLVRLKVKVLKYPDIEQLEEIKLHNVKRCVTVSSLTENEMTLSGASSTSDVDGDNILIAGAETASDELQIYEYACVFPAQEWSDGAGNAIDFLTIRADGEEATFKLKKMFFSGYEYSMTIVLNGHTLNNTATISNWADASDCLVNPTKIKGGSLNIAAVDDQTYTGSAIVLEPTVSYEDPVTTDVRTLILNTDYTLKYINNVNAGLSLIIAEGKLGTDYEGMIGVTSFNIIAIDLTKAVISNINDVTYNRAPHEPKPAVTLSGKLLVEGVDFVYGYSSNTDAGTATVIITPAVGSIYTNSTSKVFTINPKNLSDSYVKVVLSSTGFIYDGTEKSVTAMVTDTNNGNTVTLTPSDEYTINGLTGTAEGVYVVTVTGQNNYSGTKTVTWSIFKKGVFTINSSGNRIKFSRGNLFAKYSGSSWTWSFANNQWDYIGNAAGNTSINGNGTVAVNNVTVDLFGWVGASSSLTGVAQYGILSSTNVDGGSPYGIRMEGMKSHWGNVPGIGTGWRPLTRDEWSYILQARASAANVNGINHARYTHATINTDEIGVNGLILFPDGVTIASSEADSWGVINGNSEWATKCTTSQWSALEDKGCVFLPAAGYRDGTTVSGVGVSGVYWSSTGGGAVNGISAYSMYFGSNMLYDSSYSTRQFGYSVRLVKNAE